MITFQQSEQTAARPDLRPRRDSRLKKDTHNNTHKYITAHFGKANHCENKNGNILNKSCGGVSKVFHWANKNHSFSRDINDYYQLCVSCHHYYDKHGLAVSKKKRSNAKSLFLGVTFRSDTGRWRALIPENKLLNIVKRVNIGTFDTAEEAARARDQYIMDNLSSYSIPLNFSL